MLKKLTLTLSLMACSLPALAEAPASPEKVPAVKTNPVSAASGQSAEASQTTPVQVKNDAKAVDVLVKKLESIRTLSAKFNQEMVADNGRKQSLSGELQIKRPDMFVWNTEQPYSQEIITRGGKVWSIDHDLMQVVIQKQDTDTENTPAQLLSGNPSEFLKNYYVVVIDYRGDKTYSLRPTNNNALFELLEIHFKQDELAGFTMTDSMGGKRRIDLKEVNINGMISNSRFQAKYPEDYDVIDETAVSRTAG